VAAGNAAIVREGFEAFGRRDIEAVLARFDPEIEIHNPDVTAEVYCGHDGYRRFLGDWLEGWDEFKVEPIEFIESGDWVVVPCRLFARGRGSGLELVDQSAQMFRFRDDKIVEYWLFGDPEEAFRVSGIAQ
jgi:ketosteroid isomerase-like protein